MSKEYILRDEEALPLIDVIDRAEIPLMAWSSEVQQIWNSYMAGLAEVIEGSVPGCSVKIHSLSELAEAKEAMVLDPEAPAVPVSYVPVTLDSYDIKGHKPLELSRHFSVISGKLLGIGKRPGSNKLKDQFAGIKKYAGGYDIVLYEDDIFTGKTAKETMERLEKHGVGVSSFIAGIQITDKLVDPRIDAVYKYDPGDVYELNDPRDFLFGSHEGGLVLKTQRGLVRAPYVLPYVNVADRASVPQENAQAFSNAIVGLNEHMFMHLEALAGKPIMVKDGSPAFFDFVGWLYGPKVAARMTMLEFCEALN